MSLANQLESSDFSSINDTDLVKRIINEQEQGIEGYFIDLRETILFNNTWLRYKDGSNFIYELISKTDNETIVFSQGSNLVY